MKLNNVFRAENVKDVSGQIHRFGKHAGSYYESDESIHYKPGYSVNYYSSEESN